MYDIETEDFYRDICGDVGDKFDISDYPEDHMTGIPTGKKKEGHGSDEG